MSTDLNTDDLASLLNSWDEPNDPSPPMDVETDFPIGQSPDFDDDDDDSAPSRALFLTPCRASDPPPP